MIIQKSMKSAFYDCDDTLVLWNNNRSWSPSDKKSIIIADPYIEYNVFYLRPNKTAIQHLKDQKLEGTTIVVWSKGGWLWAQQVVKALKLENDVDLVMAKPDMYIDDLECKDFMGRWLRVNKNGSLTEDTK